MASSIPPQFASYDLKHTRPFSHHAPASGWEPLDDPKIIQSPIEYSLIFVVDRDQDKVLLGLKRRGMGVNLYNGFGGKPEKSETMLQCAARELQEEAGIASSPGGLVYKGVLYSARPRSNKDPTDDVKIMIKVHFFACTAWSGIPQTSEEMIPQWFKIWKGAQAERSDRGHSPLPVDQMWPEASFYLEPVLRSILDGHDDELFLGRINYELLSKREAPTSLPALDGLTIQADPCADQDDRAERLDGWWMVLIRKSEAIDEASMPCQHDWDV
ncbi:hypothetical protein I317_01310 [Kwoniella heveanensis CBS 569]|uniref:Nudix hydrolase domain-containing protein n=1 Tax=Kwoniella heveanensis BCC8398 TaxID=1296120 RepID=A0A1B9GS76_9TREE|nr:hypothetical protein I316_04530 [Kwoniella heveanensis BCC8398]OCF44821.1 hypothetical protein I317_01310 [Kwoniella heveanensis CBS 569]